ncbi:MAG: (2Fe-2S)-binding protein [Deltaproteobacteria bacterium]|nr:(2Fe-2S)-binding protein [Deltaproteobacteria bacterium]
MSDNYPLVTGTIDGLEFAAERETTLLEAARRLGINIPTLCDHPGLPPDGNCRLCLAESGGKLVASCLFPLRASGAAFLTRSPLVMEARGFVISLLLSRAPEDAYLMALAEEHGVSANPRLADVADGCVRCGRCVRACQATGSEAIGFVGRGRQRKVTGPFFEPPDDCVGCLACARACPTGYIEFGEEPRSIWGRDFELAKCPACGQAMGTLQELERSGSKSPVCPACRRRAYAESLRGLPQASFNV